MAYNFVLEHMKGKKTVIVDALLRQHCDDEDMELAAGRLWCKKLMLISILKLDQV